MHSPHASQCRFIWGLSPYHGQLLFFQMVACRVLTGMLLMQMCTGFHPEKLGECATEFVRSYAAALMTFNELVAQGKL